eukprot:m.339024 g.339024  ORF g.339024 m.339024 type:complete len:1189 (-) comp18636_c0_seq1:668-4234(-)
MFTTALSSTILVLSVSFISAVPFYNDKPEEHGTLSLHPKSSGSGNSATEKVTVIVSSEEIEFVLELRTARELTDRLASVPEFAGIARDIIYYSGYVQGEHGSSVRMRAVKGHLLSTLKGTVFTSKGVWIVGDNEKELEPVASGKTSRRKRTVDSGKAVVTVKKPRGDLREGSRQGRNVEGINVDNACHADFGETEETNNLHEAKRMARAVVARASVDHTICPMFLDADMHFYEQWKGTCEDGETEANCKIKQKDRVIAKMVDLIHLSNGVFQQSAVGSNITLVIAGVRVDPDSSPITASNKNFAQCGQLVLDDYAGFVASADAYSSGGNITFIPGTANRANNDVCLNHFFTHYDCQAALGVAFTFAVCQQDFVNNKAANVGYTSSLSFGAVKPHWSSGFVTAHEIGHNLGAIHDCCINCDKDIVCVDCNLTSFKSGQQRPCPGVVTPEINISGISAKYTYENTSSVAPFLDTCVASDRNTEGDFLMYPLVSADLQQSNSGVLSSCSLALIEFGLESAGGCLETTGDACSTTGSSGVGTCCDGNSLQSAGFVCRERDVALPCVKESKCDGENTGCPYGDYEDDGTACDLPGHSGFAECLSGECVPRNTGQCSQLVSSSVGCTVPGFPCVVACDAAPQGCLGIGEVGICGDVAQSTGFTYNGPTGVCPLVPNGTICLTNDGYNGTCDAQGSCVITNPCDAGGLCCKNGQIKEAGTPCQAQCDPNALCDGVSEHCEALRREGNNDTNWIGKDCVGKTGRCAITGCCESCYDEGAFEGTPLNTNNKNNSECPELQQFCGKGFDFLENKCPDTCGNCADNSADICRLGQCPNQWNGTFCDECPPIFDKMKNCNACADSYFGFPDCAQCTPTEFCSGNSLSATPSKSSSNLTTADICSCICLDNFNGTRCDRCSFNHYGSECKFGFVVSVGLKDAASLNRTKVEEGLVEFFTTAPFSVNESSILDINFVESGDGLIVDVAFVDNTTDVDGVLVNVTLAAMLAASDASNAGTNFSVGTALIVIVSPETLDSTTTTTNTAWGPSSTTSNGTRNAENTTLSPTTATPTLTTNTSVVNEDTDSSEDWYESEEAKLGFIIGGVIVLFLLLLLLFKPKKDDMLASQVKGLREHNAFMETAIHDQGPHNTHAEFADIRAVPNGTSPYATVPPLNGGSGNLGPFKGRQTALPPTPTRHNFYG